jgi:hypothetical protein
MSEGNSAANKNYVPILRMALGGISSVVAASVTHPIDSIKIRLQKEGELSLKTEKKYKNIVNGF